MQRLGRGRGDLAVCEGVPVPARAGPQGAADCAVGVDVLGRDGGVGGNIGVWVVAGCVAACAVLVGIVKSAGASRGAGSNALPQKGSGKPVSRRSLVELVVLVGLWGTDILDAGSCDCSAVESRAALPGLFSGPDVDGMSASVWRALQSRRLGTSFTSKKLGIGA